jgi:hypothetical protein
VFGDLKESHGLIVASAGAPEGVLTELASRYTDRLLPTEISSEPFSCGFPLTSCYAVTRTFPVQASRSGIVQTHALLLPIKNAVISPY